MFFLPLVPNCQLSLSHLLGITKTYVSFTSVQTDKLFFNMRSVFFWHRNTLLAWSNLDISYCIYSIEQIHFEQTSLKSNWYRDLKSNWEALKNIFLQTTKCDKEGSSQMFEKSDNRFGFCTRDNVWADFMHNRIFLPFDSTVVLIFEAGYPN